MEYKTIKLIENIYNKLKIQSMFADTDFKIDRKQIESIFEDNTYYVVDEENSIFEPGIKKVNLQTRVSKKALNIFYKPADILIAFIGVLGLSKTSTLKDYIIFLTPVIYEIYKSLSIELSDNEIKIYISICRANEKGIRVTKDNIDTVICNEIGVNMVKDDILVSINNLKHKKIIDDIYGYYKVIEEYK